MLGLRIIAKSLFFEDKNSKCRETFMSNKKILKIMIYLMHKYITYVQVLMGKIEENIMSIS